MTNILDIFGTPGVEPLNKHMRKVFECTKMLGEFFTNVLNSDWEKAKTAHEKILILENEADTLKEHARTSLPRGLYMSIDRAELFDIISLQDKIANKVKMISGLIYNRQMIVPESIQLDCVALLDKATTAAEYLLKINQDIKKILSVSFRSHETELMANSIKQLDQIEDDTDNLQLKLRQLIFKLE